MRRRFLLRVYKCPICACDDLINDDTTTDEDDHDSFRCTQGHLIQPFRDFVQVITLNEDGDELYSLEFDAEGKLTGLVNWSLGRINLEGGTK